VSHDSLDVAQTTKRLSIPPPSNSSTSFHFPLSNVTDEILDTSSLVGWEGSDPFILELVD